jgi:tetratricopeptide (TPR) repeat protein
VYFLKLCLNFDKQIYGGYVKKLSTALFVIALVHLCTLFAQDKDAVMFYNSGLESEKANNIDEAISYYSMAIGIDAKYTKAYLKRGDAYRKVKNNWKAKNDYLSVIKLDPKIESAHHNLGHINYETKEYSAAITNFTNALALNSTDAEVYYLRGSSYLMLNDYSNAEKDLLKVQELIPGYADVNEKLEKIRLEGGITVSEEKKKEEPLTEIKKEEPVVETKKEEPIAEVKKDEPVIDKKENEVPVPTYGTIEEKKDVTQPEVNIEEKKESPVEIKPSADELIRQGMTYYESGNYSSAIDIYNKVIEYYPDNAEAHFQKGRAYTEMNDYSSAIDEYTKTVQKNTGHFKAFINRGYIYNERKEYERAISDYKKGIELDPNSSFGYYNLGVAYFSSGNRDKAAESFRQAANLGDSDASDWLKANGFGQ